MLDLYVDIDALAAYPQVLHAAQRHSLDLYVVTRDYLPATENVHLIALQDDQLNGGGWIAANISRGDICVTADPGLATNCIWRGALALSPIGRQWGVDAAGDEARVVAGPWSSDARAFVQRLEKAIASARAELDEAQKQAHAESRKRGAATREVSSADGDVGALDETRETTDEREGKDDVVDEQIEEENRVASAGALGPDGDVPSDADPEL